MQRYRLFSHNVVAIETSAIGWPPWLITFWYPLISEQLHMLMHEALTWFLQIQRYQNVINQGGHPIALVSMATTLCETRLLRAFSQLGENSSEGHVFTPFFQNTSLSLFDFILKGGCKVKKQIEQQSSTGSSLPLCILFILNFPLEPTEKAWQREPGAQKTHYFFVLKISFIQGGGE